MKNIRQIIAAGTCVLALTGTFMVSNAAETGKPAKPTKHHKLKAKITEAQAKAAALKAKPGKVTEVELEKEGGIVVYGIDITAEDGKMFDVVVDANTGKVLKVEAEDPNEKDDDEKGKDDKDEKDDDKK